MTDSIHKIIGILKQSERIRIVYHVVFWLFVAFFYFILFSWNSDFREVSIIFSTGLLPVAILVTYFFNYTLVPKYLWKKRYGRFFLFSFYTLLVATWLSFLIVFYALIHILNTKASLDPAVLQPELQVMTLYFVVFFAIATKQVKRAFIIQQEKNELVKTKLSTELKLKEAELKILKAQIHPHFLFNTLNNLYGLTLEKSDEAPGLVLRLSEILDYILYQVDKPRVSLQEDIMHIREYIELEKVRFQDTLNVTMNIQEVEVEIEIAPMMLLPFVENAFKHGDLVEGYLTLFISLSMKNDRLDFTIRNSVMQHDNEESKTGIGLENIRKRLELHYKDRFKLKHEFIDSWYSVDLSIFDLKAVKHA